MPVCVYVDVQFSPGDFWSQTEEGQKSSCRLKSSTVYFLETLIQEKVGGRKAFHELEARDKKTVRE